MPPQDALLVACDVATLLSAVAITIVLARLIYRGARLPSFGPLLAAGAATGAGVAIVFLVVGFGMWSAGGWTAGGRLAIAAASVVTAAD